MQPTQVLPVKINITKDNPLATSQVKPEEELPKVFLSYQWRVQKKVKKLKNALEKDGYRCWMDIEQMNGGDQLLDKIAVGLRNAEVVILCLTNLYIKSKNCLLEARYAHELGRTIIPLIFDSSLIEESWPPEELGLILSGKVYTKFLYDEDVDALFMDLSDRPWLETQYLELVRKLDYEFKKSISRIPKIFKRKIVLGVVGIIVYVIMLLCLVLLGFLAGFFVGKDSVSDGKTTTTTAARTTQTG